ncbi:MAG: hypothetical protein GY757_18480, partial [bacterium]|nr:hypothetical protein [bacterium]
ARIYLLQEMDPESTGYNLPRLIPFPGNTDKKKLEETARQLIKRHESLRTSFTLVNGKPVQIIHENQTIAFEIPQYRLGNKKGEKEQTAQVVKIAGENRNPFNLAEAPLLRLTMIEIPGESVYLLFDMHHIVTDGTSRNIITREFLKIWNE